MSDFALSEAIINFAAGTAVNWNAFQLPIPANMVVYTIDTKKFKRGDGYRKYSELPDGPSISGILSGDVSAANLLDQLVPADDDSLIIVDNLKYVASTYKLSSLVTRVETVITSDVTQNANLATATSQFGMLNTNISIADNNKLAVTSSNKMAVGPTQESFISLSPIPLLSVKGIEFFSDANCTDKIDSLTSGQICYAKIQCTHDTADIDALSFSISDNSALTTLAVVGRGVYKVTVSTTTVDASSVFTATVTYNTESVTVNTTVAISKNRTVLWGLYAGVGEDYLNSIAIDSSGNIFAAGSGTTASAGSGDCYIIKTDSNMNILARKRFGGTGNEWVTSMCCDPSGNVFVVGSTYSQSFGDNDGLLFKFDNNLNLVTQKVIGGAGSEQTSRVVCDASGNVYVTGISTSATPGIENCLIAKLDNSLNILYQKHFSGGSHDQGGGICLDSTGNVYVVGFTESEGAGGRDAFIIKLDSSLNLLIQKRYGGTGNDLFAAVTSDASNNIYAVGSTASEGAGLNEGLIVKFDSNLNILAKKRIGGLGADAFERIVINPDGEIIVTGNSNSEGDTAGLIYKFDSSLNAISKKFINTLGTDYLCGMVVDASGNIYVAGYVPGYAYDGLIIKFPKVIPAGSFEILPDIGLKLNDSYLAINDSNLTFATSTLTLSTATLSVGPTTIGIYDSGIYLNKGSVQL
jgi:hypothetical protein